VTVLEIEAIQKALPNIRRGSLKQETERNDRVAFDFGARLGITCGVRVFEAFSSGGIAHVALLATAAFHQRLKTGFAEYASQLSEPYVYQTAIAERHAFQEIDTNMYWDFRQDGSERTHPFLLIRQSSARFDSGVLVHCIVRDCRPPLQIEFV
jgi:hypothetical protein